MRVLVVELKIRNEFKIRNPVKSAHSAPFHRRETIDS